MEFSVKKGANDFRIFCLGGSTTEGIYSHKRFSDILVEMLSRAGVKKNIEMINLGISTLNSYQVEDFVREIVNYEPDLLILYLGHNEVYGPMGIASTARISKSYRLTQIAKYFKRYKVVQLLEDQYLKFLEYTYLKKLGDDSVQNRTGSLFQVVAGSVLPPSSPLRQKSLQFYTWNLDKIIQHSEDHNIPFILTTIASNIRDLRPFDSEVPEEVAIAQEWQTLLKTALTLKHEQRYQKAEEKFLAAIGLFPENAQQYYDLGQLYLAQENYDSALEAFTKARDFDIIPFRAPSSINDVIKQKAGETKAVLLDVEEIFKTKSAGGLIGKPIMVEHLHPSSYGHYLIAAGLTGLIFDQGLLKQEKEFDIDDPEVQASFNVKINAEFFEAKIRWPFTINNKDYRFP
jgi:tetratricopeptide (TPR) repeat protein